MAAAKKIGFAVVGLGSIAKGSVLPAFVRCKRAKLVAAVARNKKSAVPIAKKFKATFVYGTDNFAECLANPDVDAIYLATPQGEHLDLTLQAAKAGKHVLCEKPLAATVDQAAAMVEACQRKQCPADDRLSQILRAKLPVHQKIAQGGRVRPHRRDPHRI